MGIESVQSPTAGAVASATRQAGAGEMDKEAFLKLLLAQLKNQDPLSPMEGTEFVQQLATLSTVEQSMKQNATLELMSLQLTGLAGNEAVGLIGKEVTIRGEHITFDGVNPTGFSANLAKPAADVTVTIRDANGNAVRTMELGQKPAGAMQVPWDGRNDAGQVAQAGKYSVEVSARDANGNPVTVTQDVKGIVVGVSFEKGYPEVQLDSGATAPISDLVAVATASPPPLPLEPQDLTGRLP